MNRASIESGEARRHHSAAQAAKDREVLDPHTANAIAKSRREQEMRAKRYREWKSLVSTDDFGAFMAEEGLRLEASWPAMPDADEAEFSAIGAMLQTPHALKYGAQILQPAHLRRRGNRNILRAILAVRQRCQSQKERVVVDVVTVAQELRRAGMLEESGGCDYLFFCVRECPNSHNIRAYVSAILEASRLRFLFLVGDALQEESRHGNEPQRLVNALRRAADDIEHRGFTNPKTIFERTK